MGRKGSFLVFLICGEVRGRGQLKLNGSFNDEQGGGALQKGDDSLFCLLGEVLLE